MRKAARRRLRWCLFVTALDILDALQIAVTLGFVFGIWFGGVRRLGLFDRGPFRLFRRYN